MLDVESDAFDIDRERDRVTDRDDGANRSAAITDRSQATDIGPILDFTRRIGERTCRQLDRPRHGNAKIPVEIPHDRGRKKGVHCQAPSNAARNVLGSREPML